MKRNSSPFVKDTFALRRFCADQREAITTILDEPSERRRP